MFNNLKHLETDINVQVNISASGLDDNKHINISFSIIKMWWAVYEKLRPVPKYWGILSKISLCLSIAEKLAHRPPIILMFLGTWDHDLNAGEFLTISVGGNMKKIEAFTKELVIFP